MNSRDNTLLSCGTVSWSYPESVSSPLLTFTHRAADSERRVPPPAAVRPAPPARPSGVSRGHRATDALVGRLGPEPCTSVRS